MAAVVGLANPTQGSSKLKNRTPHKMRVGLSFRFEWSILCHWTTPPTLPATGGFFISGGLLEMGGLRLGVVLLHNFSYVRN